MFCCNNSFFNLNRTCVTDCTSTCGPMVVMTCSDCCTRVCSRVTYTVTITNPATCTIECAALHCRLAPSFCFNRGTVTVNGTANADATPECISLGTIAPGATVTVTYVVTVMECKRYNKSQACLSGLVCCCCESKRLVIPSNVSVLQVCCCCGGSSTTTETTGN